MNQVRLIFRASILVLAFAWTSAASAQSRDIEPVEAKVTAKSGENTATQERTCDRERIGDKAKETSECRQSEIAEHRQERRGSGATTGATGSASGRGGQS